MTAEAESSTYYFMFDSTDDKNVTSMSFGDVWLYFYYEALVGIIHKAEVILLKIPEKNERILMPSVSKYAKAVQKAVLKDAGLSEKDAVFLSERELQDEAMKRAGREVLRVVDNKIGK